MLMLCYVMLRCLLNFCWQLLRSHCFYSTTLSTACLCYVMLCYRVVGIVVANSSIRIASTESHYLLHAYVMLCYVMLCYCLVGIVVANSSIRIASTESCYSLHAYVMLCYV